MANIEPEEATWADIPQLEKTTRGLAGPGGPLNAQALALAKRVAWLRERSKLWVNLEDFRLSSDLDDTLSFQRAAAAIANGGNLHVTEVRSYTVRSSILFKWNNSISFAPGVKIVPAAGGAFTSNAVFLVNSSDGSSPSPVSFPNVCGFWENLWVDNSDTPDLVVGALILGAPMEVRNIRTNSTHFTVRTTNSYLDHFRVLGAYITQPRGADYQISLTGLGDGLVLESIHAYSDIGIPNAVQLINCRGGVVSGSIGGNYRFSRCKALVFQGFHLETGRVLSRGSDLAMRDGFFYASDSPRVAFENTAERRTAIMENIHFTFNNDKIPAGYSPYDVEVCDDLSLTVRDCYKITGADSDSGKSEQCGILVRHNVDGPMVNWNRFSHFLSQNGKIKRNKVVHIDHKQSCGAGTLYTNTFSALSNLAVWGEASGTYYYNAILLWDPVRRTGITNSEIERSHVVTAGGNAVTLPLNGLGRLASQGVFRLYRGAASGVYTHYVDIPIVNCANLIDTGKFVNGFAWQSRPGGGKDQVDTTGAYEVNNDRCALRRTAAPTAGTYQLGDRVDHAEPAASGFMGWVCVAAGSPGTWKTWGAITA